MYPNTAIATARIAVSSWSSPATPRRRRKQDRNRREEIPPARQRPHDRDHDYEKSVSRT
jgi:hypothetical protein